VLYVAKLNEAEIKGEVESKIPFGNNLIIEEMKNYFDSVSDGQEYTGLNLVIGGYSIHLLEGEGPLAWDMLKALNEDIKDRLSGLYQQVWVLHYTEECPNRVFQQWMCRSIQVSSTKEIKALPPFEKAWTIYEGMCEIGRQIAAQMSKGASSVNN